MMSRTLALLLLAACGGSSSPAGDDTVVDAAAAPDASHPCDPTAPFGAPTPITGLPLGVRGFHLTDDERTAYFAMTNAPTPGIYSAHRDDLASDFGTPKLVLDPHGMSLALSADVSLDEKSILVGANVGDEHIFRATRASTDDAFGDMTQVTGANHVGENDEQPFLSHDGTTLWFSSGGPMNLYTAAANPTGFDEPTAVAGLGTPNMFWPVVSADQQSLYFLRAANTTSLMITHRDSTSGAWSTPVSLSHMGLDGQYTAPTWISLDQCRLYVYTVSNESQGGTERVYVAERSPS